MVDLRVGAADGDRTRDVQLGKLNRKIAFHTFAILTLPTSHTYSADHAQNVPKATRIFFTIDL